MSFYETVIKKAREVIEKFSLICSDERVLVGFSGGADSTVLLCVMHEILGERVCAFHVNHMLRGDEADADELFCKKFCLKKGIPFNSVHIDVAALANGSGVEEAARNARYGALTAECERIGAQKIALAHTASDNMETVIFNLARGASLSGMRGIPPKRAQGKFEVIRPLILCTRAEIEGFCTEKELDFCTDKTNVDINYTRNFIRHKIAPLIKEINPSAEERIVSASENLARDESFITEEARRFAELHGISNSCNVKLLLSVHEALRSRIIAKMYGSVSNKTLESRHFDEIDKFIENGKNGSRIILPGKTAALFRGEDIIFISEDDYSDSIKKDKFSYQIHEGTSDFGTFSVLLFPTEKEECELIKTSSQKASFTAKTVLPESAVKELYVRNRENGEKYVFGGMTRTLKKLLSGADEKAKTVRPVFCDDSGVLWFPPFRIRDDVYARREEAKYILCYFEY